MMLEKQLTPLISSLLLQLLCCLISTPEDDDYWGHVILNSGTSTGTGTASGTGTSTGADSSIRDLLLQKNQETKEYQDEQFTILAKALTDLTEKYMSYFIKL